MEDGTVQWGGVMSRLNKLDVTLQIGGQCNKTKELGDGDNLQSVHAQHNERLDEQHGLHDAQMMYSGVLILHGGPSPPRLHLVIAGQLLS